MRIQYFHQHFSTPLGSTGTRSFEFAKRLIARGHSVTMICGSYGGGDTGLRGEFVHGERRGIVEGIEVIEFELPYANSDRFLRRTLIFLRFVVRSLRVALFSGADLVIATSTPLTVAVPGIFAKLLRGRRFIFEVRDLWPELPREMGVIKSPIILGAMSLLERAAYKSADACIALAPGIEAGIRRIVPEKRVAMIPNGCDIDGDSVAPQLSAQVSAVLTANVGKLKCVFAGAHGIANGLDAALDAAAELKRRQRDDIVLIFVGTGMQKQALMERARAEALANCVFLDPIPKRMLVEMHKHVDVGLMVLRNVSAFYNGTSPNKFFDYLSAGLPILINYAGWLAEMVVAEDCGVAVTPDDPVAFADGLEVLASDADRRMRMGVRARALSKERFSRDRLASEFVNFVETV